MEIKILVTIIYDALTDLVPFVQFKKCEKHLRKSVTLACNFTKSNIPPWMFFTNGTKSCMQYITYVIGVLML